MQLTRSRLLLGSLRHCHSPLPTCGFAHTALSALDPWASLPVLRPTSDAPAMTSQGLFPLLHGSGPLPPPLISIPAGLRALGAYLILLLVPASLRAKSTTHSPSGGSDPPSSSSTCLQSQTALRARVPTHGQGRPSSPDPLLESRNLWPFPGGPWAFAHLASSGSGSYSLSRSPGRLPAPPHTHTLGLPSPPAPHSRAPMMLCGLSQSPHHTPSPLPGHSSEPGTPGSRGH